MPLQIRKLENALKLLKDTESCKTIISFFLANNWCNFEIATWFVKKKILFKQFIFFKSASCWKKICRLNLKDGTFSLYTRTFWIGRYLQWGVRFCDHFFYIPINREFPETDFPVQSVSPPFFAQALVSPNTWGGRGSLLRNHACLNAALGVILVAGSHSKHLRMKSRKRGSSQPFSAVWSSLEPGGPLGFPLLDLPPLSTVVPSGSVVAVQ